MILEKEPKLKIRPMEEKDIDRVMEIWMIANKETHSFIDPSYWEGQEKYVREMIFGAEVYLCEQSERILGFAGLQGQYLAGIFVEKDSRGQGYGSRLLKFCMERTRCLSLHVYRKNDRAMEFYLTHGFKIDKAEMDTELGEVELFMSWEPPGQRCEIRLGFSPPLAGGNKILGR